MIYSTYQNAVGKENMRVLSSFNDLPMYNFGVQVVKEMEDEDKAYLEQNIQAAIAQKEIDLEDALAIRNMKDINQAERLLIVRRKKRMQKAQEQQMQQIQAQGQQQQQAQQMEAQSKQQEIQMVAQIEQQKIQMKGEMELRLATAQHEFNKEIEIIRAEAMGRKVSSDKDVKVEVEKMKDDRKDDRVKKQAVEQSKLISQRQGQRGELQDETKEDPQDIMSGLLDKIMR